jgi:hypothetical protein
MTAVDDEALAAINEAMAEVGISATYIPLVDNYTVADGDNDQAAAVPVEIVITPPSAYKQFFVDGDTVRAEDLKTITRTEIKTGGRINDWVIVSVSPIISGELTVGYKAQLRG